MQYILRSFKKDLSSFGVFVKFWQSLEDTISEDFPLLLNFQADEPEF